MDNVVQQLFSNNIPKEKYNEMKYKVETYEEVLKFCSAEQIKRDTEEIERLKQERDIYKGQVEEADKRVEEAHKLVEEVKKAYNEVKENAERNAKREAEAEKEEKIRNFKYNTNSKKIKPLEERIKELESVLNTNKEILKQLNKEKDIADKKVIEVETLLKSRNEEIERLKTIDSKVDTIDNKVDKIETVNNKLDTIDNYLKINIEEIKTIIKNSSSKEEIIDIIEEKEEKLKNNGRSDDLERDVQMAKELAKGESKSTVASKYLGHRSQPMSALSRKLKADRFIRLIEYFKGNISDPPVVYKEVIK